MRSKLSAALLLALIVVGAAWAYSQPTATTKPTSPKADGCCVTGDCCCPGQGSCCDPTARAKATTAAKKGPGCCVTGDCCCPGQGSCCGAVKAKAEANGCCATKAKDIEAKGCDTKAEKAGFVCPLTGERLPCEKCCPLNEGK